MIFFYGMIYLELITQVYQKTEVIEIEKTNFMDKFIFNNVLIKKKKNNLIC